MKRKTNRILSLLLAFVMAFSLVPTAAAATHTHSAPSWTISSTQHWKICTVDGELFDQNTHTYGALKETLPATCTTKGMQVETCTTCFYEHKVEIPALSTSGKHTKEGNYSSTATQHSYYCSRCKNVVTENHTMVSGKCSVCDYEQPIATLTVSPTSRTIPVGGTATLTANMSVSWSTSDANIATVSTTGVVTGVSAGRATITATSGTQTAACIVDVTGSSTTNGLTYPSTVYVDAVGTSKQVTIKLNNSYYYDYDDVTWSISSYNNTGSVSISKTGSSSDWSSTAYTEFDRYDETSIYVRGLTNGGSATLTATLYNTYDRRPVTVSILIVVGTTTSSEYSLSPYPATSSSIYLYYDDYRYDYNYPSYRNYYADFSVTPMNYSSKLDTSRYDITYYWSVNTTSQSNSSKDSFRLYAYNSSLTRSRNSVSCYARIYYKNTNTLVATTPTVTWSNIYTDYYQDNTNFTVSATVYDTTSRYNLNDKDDKNGSSIISQISDKLYDYYYSSSYGRDYISYVRFSNVTSSYGSLDASTSRDYYYDSSRSGYYDLRDVDFTPTKTGTASFDCTVHGTRGNTYKCTINIKVEAGTTDKTASTINYSTKGTKSVTLSASDFTSRYKDVVGSSASTLTIKFRNVPSNGTLKYNSTTLTSSNIGNYEFSSSSSASYRISDVTYTPKNNSNTTDTIDYYCYSGSTRRFSGSIKFTNTAETVTVPSGVTVSYSTTGASVTFSAPDFYNKHSAMLSASYIVFGSPTSGTLSSGGSAVASGTKFGYTVDTAKGYKNLASVSYKPASGYNGTATIPFTAYNPDGTTAATGNVSILVSQTPTSTTTPTTTTTFKDVPSGEWYTSFVTSLASAGIVSGDPNGNFRPKDDVTYGEALKMVMVAAGYPKQTELTGANWAQNYLTLAINNSILSGSASDYTLSKAISRTAMATMVSKALKLTPVTSGTSPYTDTNDGYVRALTNAGIVEGDASSGTPKWRGNDPLTRAEMCKIVYKTYQYRNVTPSGSSATTDTSSKPDWLK